MLNTQFISRTLLSNHPNFQLNHSVQPLRPKKLTSHLNPITNNLLSQTLSTLDITQPIEITNLQLIINNIHTSVVNDYLTSLPLNPILNTTTPNIDPSINNLPRTIRVKLSQLRTNLSPFLRSYQHRLDPTVSPICPKCTTGPHTTSHLFSCPALPISPPPPNTSILWSNGHQAVEYLDLNWPDWLNVPGVQH